MDEKELLKKLKQDIKGWNKWRDENAKIKPDLSRANLRKTSLRKANLGNANLSGADLRKTNLRKANLGNADLSRADLREANLRRANLSEANLRKANLRRANLSRANLNRAKLHGANLRGANLDKTDLSGADLSKADLNKALLIKTKFNKANLTNSRVYGISVWNLKTDKKTKQLSLVITDTDEPVVTVDNLEVAQFIYFILTNKKIRNVINTVANKAVLILGRFTKKRKKVLDAIADKLRTMDLVPIIFDFKKSKEQDIIETVVTLASLSKFIIADVTAARVIADELRSFVPDFAVPVVPVFQPSKKEPKPYASLNTLCRKYTWVFEPVIYENKKHLIEILPNKVIKPAEDKRLKLRDIK